MQLHCSSALSEGAVLSLTLPRRSHGMSVARTLSGNTVFSCVTNPFTFNKLEAGGVERYAPTDNTQLIEKVRTQEPHNPLYARLLCTKSCTRNLKAE
jgi:hypothetical protein